MSVSVNIKQFSSAPFFLSPFIASRIFMNNWKLCRIVNCSVMSRAVRIWRRDVNQSICCITAEEEGRGKTQGNLKTWDNWEKEAAGRRESLPVQPLPSASLHLTVRSSSSQWEIIRSSWYSSFIYFWHMNYDCMMNYCILRAEGLVIVATTPLSF